jgi:DNA-binding transcriptional regulator YhcF (GntR family)
MPPARPSPVSHFIRIITLRLVIDLRSCLRGSNPSGLAIPVSVCHTRSVSLLNFKPQPGQTIFDQLVFAAEKSILGGEFSPGQAFPSVRTLAAELKIHPNTAQKIIHHLVAARWLEVRPGIGTVVASRLPVRPSERRRLLQEDVGRLIVEAKKVGVSLQDVIQAISAGWSELDAVAGRRK